MTHHFGIPKIFIGDYFLGLLKKTVKGNNKGMFRRFSINFAVFSMLLDGLVVLGSMICMSYVRIELNSLAFIRDLPTDIEYPVLLYLLFPVFWVIVLSGFSVYDGKKNFKLVDEFSTLSIASIVAVVVQAGFLYLSFRDFSRALFLMIILASFLGCALWRILARLVFRIRKDTLKLTRNILIVGTGAELEKTRAMILKGTGEKSRKVICLDIGEHKVFFREDPLKCPEALDLLHSVVKKETVSDVIMAFPRHLSGWVEPVALGLDEYSLGVWVALDYYDLSLAETRVENLGGLPILDLRAPALGEYSRIIKRSFDLVFACLSLLLVSPLILLAGLLILIFDGWPVFFLQKRVGQNGKIFEIIKFRSMQLDAEKQREHVESLDEDGNLIHKQAADPRVTPLGRILRRFSLDEIPQLFNVLKGEMSIVGPRPELPYLVENYERWQRRRLSVLPGITGWWQVQGRSDRIMHLHTEDDIYYVENYSIWLDMKIIMRTFWVVIIGKGAY